MSLSSRVLHEEQGETCEDPAGNILVPLTSWRCIRRSIFCSPINPWPQRLSPSLPFRHSQAPSKEPPANGKYYHRSLSLRKYKVITLSMIHRKSEVHNTRLFIIRTFKVYIFVFYEMATILSIEDYHTQSRLYF